MTVGRGIVCGGVGQRWRNSTAECVAKHRRDDTHVALLDKKSSQSEILRLLHLPQLHVLERQEPARTGAAPELVAADTVGQRGRGPEAGERAEIHGPGRREH